MKIRMLVAMLAVVGAAGVVVAQDVYSSADQVRPLLPGAEIPDASLTRLDGSTLSLRETASEKPTVLIFYRGGW